MTRYRRVETGTFHDDRFRELTPPAPGGQWLWMNLLCGARTTCFPGLVVATEAVLASDLRWPIDHPDDVDPVASPQSLRGAWRELWTREMVLADWIAGVIVLPKALLDRRGAPRETARPTSPNAVRGWAKAWGDVPECGLSAWYLAECVRFIYALDREGAARGGKSDPYRAAFEASFALPLERAKESYPNAFETRTPMRLERVPQRVGDAYPDASATRSRRVDHNQSRDVNASETHTPTRRRPARDPDSCIPVPDHVSEVSGSSPELGLGSDSGSPAVSAPDPRPPERSSAAPTPARRGYPPRYPVGATEPGSPGTGMGVAASGGSSGPAPYARPDGSAEYAAPSAVPVPPPVLPLGTVVPSAEELARRELVKRLWAKLNAIRAQMALEFSWSDVRELHPMDPGVSELNARLRELGASGEELAEHVLACAAAEAKSSVPPSVRWLTGAVFGMPQWRRYTGMRLADAAAPPGVRSTGRAPAPERAAAEAALARERQAAADRTAREKRAADEKTKTDPPLTDEDRAAIRSLAARVTKNPDAAAAAERSRAEAAFLGDDVPDGELTEEESE